MANWLTITVLIVGIALGLLLPLFIRSLRLAWRTWRAAHRLGDRVVARKVVTFESEAEMDAALRRFDRGDVSALLRK